MGQSSSSELCLKPACLHVSSHIIQNLAQNWEKIDPCTNFYEMACGGTRERWEDNTQAAGSWIQDRINRILRTVIESPYEEAVEYHSIMVRNNVDEENHRMLQQDYQSCMNEEAIIAAGASPLLRLLADFDTLWPINLNDTATLDSSEYRELQEAIIFLEGLQIPTFKAILDAAGAELQVGMPDLRDPVIIYPYISPPPLILGKPEAYEDSEELAKLYEMVLEVFSTGLLPGLPAGAMNASATGNGSDSQAQDLAKQVVEFEQKLASALLVAQSEEAAIQQANPEDEAAGLFKVPLTELQSLAPTLGLDKLISFYSPASHTPLDTVIMVQRGFFANASSLVEESSKTVIQSWMVVRIAQSLGKEVEMSPDTTGKRWEKCLRHTENSLRWIMNRYFVSATYTDDMKDLAEKMTKNVQGALVKRIPELEWMTDDVKARAIGKAEKMVHNIGYPTENPDLRSPTSLADYYQRLNITDDYFSNVLTARINNVKTAYAAIGKPVDRKEWSGSVHIVNAAYSPSQNAIFLNAGVSQPVLFHPDLPSYVVYGDMGASTIGHEITHGFDSRGHKYDERGALNAWFDNSTSAAFAERAQCFIEEYSKFQYPVSGGKQQKVDGENTLGENISDVGGLRISFDAWKALNGDEKNSKNLPGLENFTHEQLFFLSWANGYCSTTTPETNDIYISDVHSPDMIRIMGGTQNSRAFKEAWNCPNKERKCELF